MMYCAMRFHFISFRDGVSDSFAKKSLLIGSDSCKKVMGMVGKMEVVK